MSRAVVKRRLIGLALLALGIFGLRQAGEADLEGALLAHALAPAPVTMGLIGLWLVGSVVAALVGFYMLGRRPRRDRYGREVE